MCMMEVFYNERIHVRKNSGHPISAFLESAINYLTLIKTLT